jgi:hypothetical protein
MEVDKVVVVRRSWLQLAGPPWRAAVSMRDVLRAAPPQPSDDSHHESRSHPIFGPNLTCVLNHYAHQFAGMRAWRSARGNAQFLRRGGRNISGATHGSLRGSSIATILNRDEPIEKAEVKGWIRSVRKQKKIAFAALGDGSTLDSLQAVLKPEQVEQ